MRFEIPQPCSGAGKQRLEDQEIECSLQEIGAIGHESAGER